MNGNISRGFNPPSGLEIKKFVSAAVYQELDKHDYLSTNLAYVTVKWKATIELELGSSVHTVPDKISLEVVGGYQQTDEKGVAVEAGKISVVTVETAHDVEFPDLTREQFTPDEAKPAEPESANVSIAPTLAGVESYPEKFRTKGR